MGQLGCGVDVQYKHCQTVDSTALVPAIIRGKHERADNCHEGLSDHRFPAVQQHPPDFRKCNFSFFISPTTSLWHSVHRVHLLRPLGPASPPPPSLALALLLASLLHLHTFCSYLITTVAVLSSNGCRQHMPFYSSSMKTQPDRIAPSRHSIFFWLTSPHRSSAPSSAIHPPPHSSATLFFDPYGDHLRRAVRSIKIIYGLTWCVFPHS